MTAIDQRFDRVDAALADIVDELRGLRRDFTQFQDRLIQIGFGFVFVLVTAMAALLVVALD